MKRWQVLINGTNFQMPFELPKSRRKSWYHVIAPDEKTKVRRIGFYTEVFVMARSRREAELRAVDVLRRDKDLRAEVRNPKDDPPMLFADKITEIASFLGCRRPRSGLAFYVERGRKRKK
jgi:hypothetical protein